MHKHMSKRLKGILIFILLVCIYIFVLWVLKLPTSLKYQEIEAPEMILEINPANFGEVTFDKLSYTGVDYLQDGAIIGSYYYYTLSNNNKSQKERYLLVLTKTATKQSELTNYTCRFRVLETKGLPNVLSAMSANSPISYETMEEMFQTSIVSEIDYPKNGIIITYILMVLTSLGILSFLITVLKEKE